MALSNWRSSSQVVQGPNGADGHGDCGIRGRIEADVDLEAFAEQAIADRRPEPIDSDARWTEAVEVTRGEPLRACGRPVQRRRGSPPSRSESRRPCWFTGVMAITVYGVCAVSFMMVMYALEQRGRGFILGFAVGCVLSSLYGFLSGAWPFGVVELIWAGVAVFRYRRTPAEVSTIHP